MKVGPLGIAAATLPSSVPAQRCPVSSGQLITACRVAWEQGGQLVALWATDDRDRERGFTLRVLLRDAEGLTVFEHALPYANALYPDLSGIFPVANRMQRGGKKGKRARERDNAPKSAFATELQGALTEH